MGRTTKVSDSFGHKVLYWEIKVLCLIMLKPWWFIARGLLLVLVKKALQLAVNLSVLVGSKQDFGLSFVAQLIRDLGLEKHEIIIVKDQREFKEKTKRIGDEDQLYISWKPRFIIKANARQVFFLRNPVHQACSGKNCMCDRKSLCPYIVVHVRFQIDDLKLDSHANSRNSPSVDVNGIRMITLLLFDENSYARDCILVCSLKLFTVFANWQDFTMFNA